MRGSVPEGGPGQEAGERVAGGLAAAAQAVTRIELLADPDRLGRMDLEMLAR